MADLNIDMIGRTKGPGFTDPDPTHVLVDPGEVMLVGPNISSDDLEKTIETVNDGYQKLKLNHFYDATTPDATHDNLGPQPNGQRDLLSQRSLQLREDGDSRSRSSPPGCIRIITVPPTRRTRSTTRKCRSFRRRSRRWAGCWRIRTGGRKLNQDSAGAVD